MPEERAGSITLQKVHWTFAKSMVQLQKLVQAGLRLPPLTTICTLQPTTRRKGMLWMKKERVRKSSRKIH
jgi:hypothetical protein